MSYTISPLAYEDARQALERALASDKGIRMTFESHARASTFRSRCNAFRARDRKINAETYRAIPGYEPISEFDKLELSIPRKGMEGDNILSIIKRDIVKAVVEEI